jgi:hypothetical protein
MSYDHLIEHEGEVFEVEVIGYQPELPIKPFGPNDHENADPGQGEEIEFRVNNVDGDTETDLQNDPEFCKLVIERCKAEGF